MFAGHHKHAQRRAPNRPKHTQHRRRNRVGVITMEFETDALGTFTVTDAAIVDRDTYVLVAQADDADPAWQEKSARGEDLPMRIVSGNRAMDKWGWFEFDYPWRYRAGAGFNPRGKKQALFGSDGLHFFSLEYGNGHNGQEGSLNIQTSLDAIEYIDGHFYAAGGKGFLARRNGPDDWDVLNFIPDYKPGLPSFQLIKGMAADDIYLAGSRKVWHWNGTEIAPLALPEDVATREELPQFSTRSMAIDPDGSVYIGGSFGEVIFGTAKGGFQQLVAPLQEPKRELRAMTWFENALWAVTGTALYRLDEDEWERMDFLEDDDRPSAFKYLDARDGRMLVAGSHSESVFDGVKWTHLFGPKTPDAVFHQQMLQKQLDELKDLRDSARTLRDLKD
jgi:hypothetical protein